MTPFFVDEDIAVAKTLDSSFYSDPKLFEEMKEKLFVPNWHFLGNMELVPARGSIHPFILLEHYLDEPLLLTRDHEDVLHLLSNACTHRGNLVADRPCSASNLRCKYHGRLFGLNGRFISMPEFKEVRDFPTAADDLKSLPLFGWGKWLFASLQSQGSPAPYLGAMMKRLSWLLLEDFVFRPDLSRDFEVKAHWALYCENYLEGFHIPFVHAGLNSVIDFGEYTTELFERASLQLGIAKPGELSFDLPQTSPDHGKRVAAYYFFIFPNLMFNFYPWGLSVNIVKPLGIESTRISFLTYILDEKKYDRGAGSHLDRVELEDEEVVQNVQKGIRSRFYKQGRYSVTREQGTHHFHRMIASFLRS